MRGKGQVCKNAQEREKSGQAINAGYIPQGRAAQDARTGTGAIAQLVERYNGIVEVRGSIPLGSTIYPGGNRRNAGMKIYYRVPEGVL